MWPYVRAARLGDPSQPDSRVSAYLRGDKLILNKQSYSTDTIQSLPRFVRSTIDNPPVEKKSDNVTIFFGIDSPLSNFHPCSFQVDDIDYDSVEHYLAYQKALLYDMKRPVLQKRRAKRLKNFNIYSWPEKAEDLLRLALSAKFSQDIDLRDLLLSTGE